MRLRQWASILVLLFYLGDWYLCMESPVPLHEHIYARIHQSILMCLQEWNTQVFIFFSRHTFDTCNFSICSPDKCLFGWMVAKNRWQNKNGKSPSVITLFNHYQAFCLFDCLLSILVAIAVARRFGCLPFPLTAPIFLHYIAILSVYCRRIYISLHFVFFSKNANLCGWWDHTLGREQEEKQKRKE